MGRSPFSEHAQYLPEADIIHAIREMQLERIRPNVFLLNLSTGLVLLLLGMLFAILPEDDPVSADC